MSSYEGKSIQELAKLFFELGNEHLVPELTSHIEIALEKFGELQAENDELSEMIIVADVDDKLFAFATGDGSNLTGKDDDCVFYIAQSPEFNEAMGLLKQIGYPFNLESHLKLSSEVYHWIGDALSDVETELSLTIYGAYDYGESEVDPFWESQGQLVLKIISMFKKLFGKKRGLLGKEEEAIKALPEAIINEAMYSAIYSLKDYPEEILLRIHPQKKEIYDAILGGNTIVKQNNQQIKIVDVMLVLNSLESGGLAELNYSAICSTPVRHFEEKIQVEGFDAKGEPIIYKMKDGTIRVVFFELPKKDSKAFDLDKFSNEFINVVGCGMVHDDREVFHIQNPNPDSAHAIKQFLNSYMQNSE